MASNAGCASGGGPLSRGISPESHPSLVDLVGRLNNSGKHYLAADHADEISTRAGTANTSARPTRGARAGELRRRKYAAPQGHKFLDGSGIGVDIGALASTPSHRQPQQELTPASWETRRVAGEPSSTSAATLRSSFTGGVGCHEPKDCEVLVEGPLQQRALLFFWRWRWCVLTCEELRIYVDEESSLLMPERPVERHPASKLSAAPDLHFPTVLVCTSPNGTGEPLMYLRTGPGLRWEELAAASLWLRAFASLPPVGGHSTNAANEGFSVTAVGGCMPGAAPTEACAAAPGAADTADAPTSVVAVPVAAPAPAPRAEVDAHVAPLQARR